MIPKWYEAILATAILAILPSCARKQAVRFPALEERRDRLCLVREGMTTSRVFALLGQPDEVRPRGTTDLGVDGEEAYRWVFGVKTEGDLPEVGTVIFRLNHTVLDRHCPTRPFPEFPIPPVPFSESSQNTRSGMRCTIDKVYADPHFRNAPFIQVSVENLGNREFRYTNDDAGIRFSIILEVYDARKALLLREYLPAYHSLYSSERSEWPVMVVAPGGRESEDVPLLWRMAEDGRMPPGTYYVRAAFPFEENKYFGSNLVKWELPDGLDAMH